jgi:HEPN domain-containing protein
LEASVKPSLPQAGETMRDVPLDRPARPAAGAITERVRNAILAEARRKTLQEPALLAKHVRAEHLAHARDLLADVEERYRMPIGSLLTAVTTRMSGGSDWETPLSAVTDQYVFSNNGARHILLELPDAEFITMLENAVGDSPPTYVKSTKAAELLLTANDMLQAHGCNYRLGDWPRFEWIGDAKQHELVVQPALRALEDPRLQGGPRDDFERALRKRRAGATKDLEDAIVAAARSVESVLKVLHDERAVPRPKTEVVSELFKSLKDAPLPGYVANLVTAAAGPRNYVAHGPGGTVRQVPEEVADASIAAAATAITLLAHYLP